MVGLLKVVGLSQNGIGLFGFVVSEVVLLAIMSGESNVGNYIPQLTSQTTLRLRFPCFKKSTEMKCGISLSRYTQFMKISASLKSHSEALVKVTHYRLAYLSDAICFKRLR